MKVDRRTLDLIKEAYNSKQELHFETASNAYERGIIEERARWKKKIEELKDDIDLKVREILNKHNWNTPLLTLQSEINGIIDKLLGDENNQKGCGKPFLINEDTCGTCGELGYLCHECRKGKEKGVEQK